MLNDDIEIYICNLSVDTFLQCNDIFGESINPC
jgi:hypothetical protein